MNLAVSVSSYERSSSPFRDVDTYPDPSRWIPEHQCERFFIHKATAVQQVRELVRRGFDAFVCLCDGMREEDRAGVDVVVELERLGAAYTGASPHFFEMSRLALKLSCADAEVDSPAHVFAESEADAAMAATRLRFPLLVKHPNGYGSVGLAPSDRVERPDDLLPRVALKIAEFGGALIEEFIEGAEYCVLVAEPGEGDHSPRTWPPMEIKFPSGESFMHFELKWKAYQRLSVTPVADPALAERLTRCASKIFSALTGSSYARVDLRTDRHGTIFVLDVNSQPTMFYPADLNPIDLMLSRSAAGHRTFLEHLLDCAFRRQEQLRPRWRLTHDPQTGYGIAAIRDFEPGERIVILEETARRFVTKRHVEQHWQDWEKKVFGKSAVAFSDNVFRIWNKNPDEWYPFNHSCEPNAAFDGLNIVAWRPIAAGEPITVEYATFAGPDLAEFECHCGSPSCRGTIRGTDAFAPWVEERYGPHVTDYVLMIRARAALASARVGEKETGAPAHIRPLAGGADRQQELQPVSGVAIQITPDKGRGVFATRLFALGTTIEICPVIVFPEAERGDIDKTSLYNFYYEWGTDFRDGAVALGYGSLYNHSYRPNAHYYRHLHGSTVEIRAIRDILPEEEITINYNGEPDCDKPLWFTPVPEFETPRGQN